MVVDDDAHDVTILRNDDAAVVHDDNTWKRDENEPHVHRNHVLLPPPDIPEDNDAWVVDNRLRVDDRTTMQTDVPFPKTVFGDILRPEEEEEGAHCLLLLLLPRTDSSTCAAFFTAFGIKFGTNEMCFVGDCRLRLQTEANVKVTRGNKSGGVSTSHQLNKANPRSSNKDRAQCLEIVR